MMMIRHGTLVAFGLVLTATTGCADTDVGFLSGDLLFVEGCRDGEDVVFEPYKLQGTFFALQRLGDIVFIRMQPSGRPLSVTDALVVEVTDPDLVAQRLGIPIPIDNPKVRSSLHVLGSCPTSAQAMTAHGGTITFTEWGTNKGDRVAATFDFDLVDDRTGEAVGLGFEGSFSFDVKVGEPYQPFTRAGQ